TETVTYTYDHRDELTNEASSVSGAITYTYNTNGEQTGKNGQGELSTYTYDQRGRMVGASVTKSNVTTTDTFVYNEAGIRTRITEGGVERRLLVDAMNPTGYAQDVEERILVNSQWSLVAAYVYG